MRAIRSWIWISLILAAVLFSAGSVGAQEITIALGSEPTTLDPQLREDGGERAVNDNVYETLMARTPDGKLVPGLAASEPKLVDPKTWEVKLRPGIKFHNGEPFNADAVVYSVKRIIDPEIQLRADLLFLHDQGCQEGGRPDRADHHRRARPHPARTALLDEDGPARPFQGCQVRGITGGHRPLQVCASGTAART